VGVGVARAWEGGSDLYRMPRERTGEDGRFHLAGVPTSGARLALFPDLPDRISETDIKGRPVFLSPPLAGRPGEEQDLGDFWLETAGTIAGVVLDEEGEPAPRAQVIVGLPIAGLATTATKTDREGRFRVEGLLPGEYFVHATAARLDGAWRFDRQEGVRPGTSNLVLRLHSGNSVLLRFASADDPREPLLVKSGTLHREGSEALVSFGQAYVSEPRSEWRVSLEAGRHVLRFTSEGYVPVDLGEVLVEADRETVVEVILRRE
jgi:hypothetical protein